MTCWAPQDAYESQPPFDPEISSARRDFGRFPERADLEISSPVGTIAQRAIDAGAGRSLAIGPGTAWLFESQPTVRAVAGWLERTFGP